MIVKESEAGKLWCPMTQVGGSPDAMIINRGHDIVDGMEPKPKMSGCIGSRCMWWTIDVKMAARKDPYGYCGAARK